MATTSVCTGTFTTSQWNRLTGGNQYHSSKNIPSVEKHQQLNKKSSTSLQSGWLQVPTKAISWSISETLYIHFHIHKLFSDPCHTAPWMWGIPILEVLKIRITDKTSIGPRLKDPYYGKQDFSLLYNNNNLICKQDLLFSLNIIPMETSLQEQNIINCLYVPTINTIIHACHFKRGQLDPLLLVQTDRHKRPEGKWLNMMCHSCWLGGKLYLCITFQTERSGWNFCFSNIH